MDFSPQPTPKYRNLLNDGLESIYSELQESNRKVDAEIEKRDDERNKQNDENKRLETKSDGQFKLTTILSIIAIVMSIASFVVSILLRK